MPQFQIAQTGFNPGTVFHKFRGAGNTYPDSVTVASVQRTSVPTTAGPTVYVFGNSWWVDHCALLARLMFRDAPYLFIMFMVGLPYHAGPRQMVVTCGQWSKDVTALFKDIVSPASQQLLIRVGNRTSIHNTNDLCWYCWKYAPSAGSRSSSEPLVVRWPWV